MSDRELTARVVDAGDEEAFRQLFDRHSPRLLRFALRLTAGNGTAEDVLQETWLRAVEGLERFAWRSTFGTWLQGIALNVARERTREALRRRDGASMEDASPRAAVPTAAGARVERIDLERGLACLPEGRRTVLVLHDLYGYKHTEIAERLGISEGTSKSQLHAARRALETLLDGGGQDGRPRA